MDGMAGLRRPAPPRVCTTYLPSCFCYRLGPSTPPPPFPQALNHSQALCSSPQLLSKFLDLKLRSQVGVLLKIILPNVPSLCVDEYNG